MHAFLEFLLDRSAFTPHGFCLSWDPIALSTHILSDAGLGLSYLSTALIIHVFARRRRDLGFRRAFHAFTTVFALCGLTHLSDVVTIWFPIYGMQGGFKAVVALCSILTAALMWRLLPLALALPSHQALQAINRQLATEVEERQVTEKKLRAAKEAAEMASRTRSEFLATMSHELRTPLNAIIGFSEALVMRIFGDLTDRQSQYIGHINRSGQHLLQVINDILDISKIDAGKLDLVRARVDVADLVDASITLVRGRAHERNIAITTAIVPDLPAIDGDELRLKQILLNLLSNAVKFTPGAGHIQVTAERLPGRGIVLSVADTGIGMRPEDIPRALEMFTQVDNSLARKYDGTGIGLPLTRVLTELHGGRLTIESAIGRGTTVTVILPEAE